MEGLKLLSPRVFKDERGYFFEGYKRDEAYPEFVQDNISYSVKNTVRALHYQSSPGQAKLVQCLSGTIFDVAVDLREGSATFGQWKAFELSSEAHNQLYIPVGFAHGFCVLSDSALVHYKVSTFYDPKTECSIRWNDPDLKIDWPAANPILSERDQKSPYFKEVFSAYLGHRC